MNAQINALITLYEAADGDVTDRREHASLYLISALSGYCTQLSLLLKRSGTNRHADSGSQ